jgi:hypothetical protein
MAIRAHHGVSYAQWTGEDLRPPHILAEDNSSEFTWKDSEEPRKTYVKQLVLSGKDSNCVHHENKSVSFPQSPYHTIPSYLSKLH